MNVVDTIELYRELKRYADSYTICPCMDEDESHEEFFLAGKVRFVFTIINDFENTVAGFRVIL